MNLLNDKSLKWKRYTEGDDFDYPIDYSDAILDAREDGRLEILVKWEPNCYCHFHRHTAEISSLVLEGELHVTDIDIETGKELGKRGHSNSVNTGCRKCQAGLKCGKRRNVYN